MIGIHQWCALQSSGFQSDFYCARLHGHSEMDWGAAKLENGQHGPNALQRIPVELTACADCG